MAPTTTTPNEFTIACLTLAEHVASNDEPVGGPCYQALVDVLANSLMHGPIEARPDSITEARRRAAWETARLVDWARAHPYLPDALLFTENYPVVAP
ncbi:hypothetical protein [Nonomuraea sp. NPDC023979]|uniref:hypothetical protein n=1 Tax=Nonomuraea sp. NPDC023979 TaxID=3154796 RepID=UPI0033EA9BEA